MSNKIKIDLTSATVNVTPQGVSITTSEGAVIEFTLGPETVFVSQRHKFGGNPVRLPLGNDAQELAAALRCRMPKRMETRAGAYRERLIKMRRTAAARPGKPVCERPSSEGMASLAEAFDMAK